MMTGTKPFQIRMRSMRGWDSTSQEEGRNTPNRSTTGTTLVAQITTQTITRLLSTRSWEIRRKAGPNPGTLIARRVTTIT
jgi:hypothetical protein